MAINLAWDSRFEVGNERIDAEHRVFLSLIRDLSHQSEIGVPEAQMARTLREIYKYADFHFTSEENIMETRGYPERALHQQRHRYLLAELENKMHGLHNREHGASPIVDYLFQWFALHTTQEDKRLAAYVRNDFQEKTEDTLSPAKP